MTTATETTEVKRQRVEGQLYRQLPATITIRAAEPPAEGSDEPADDGLLRLHISVSSEIPYLRNSWWDDPWIEVLGHKEGECDLTRFQTGAGVVLANHDRYKAIGDTPLAGIGAIESASLAGGRMEADIIISRREALADLRQDIADNLVRNVSVGYIINERVLVRQGKDGEADEYRVTAWEPFELSLVDIPADATIGLGRSLDSPDPKNPQARYRVIDLPAPSAVGKQPSEGDRSMNTRVNAPAADTTATQTDPLAIERERAKEIRAMGRQFDIGEETDAAIDSGMSVDAFRAIVLGKMQDTGKIRMAESPEIGLSEREIKQFSFCRALLAAAEPHRARELAPFEYECAVAARDKRDASDTRLKEREGAMIVPPEVLARGMSINDDAAKAVAQRLLARAARSGKEMESYYRDLVAGTSTAGGNLVATELLGSSFIDLLRNALVLDQLGITILTGLNGNIAIPSQTGAASYYFVAENGAVTESQAVFGQVTMSPKTIGVLTDYSRRLLLQASMDVEAFVRADVAIQTAQGLQYAGLFGAGSGGESLGLFNMSGIGSVALGANGGAPTYDMLVDLETAVANANADVGQMSFLTNTKVRGKLRKTQEFASTNGKAVWTSMPGQRGIGELLGYEAYVSNSVPSNLTKGSAAGICSAMAYGYWPDLMLGLWGGLDLILDPYTGSASGTKRVVALQDYDFNARRPASFAACKDILTT